MERENYTRVTSILYPFSGLEKVPVEVVEKAAIRGTAIHKICEAIVLGIGDFNDDILFTPYIDSFKQWWKDGHEVLHLEKRFYDDDLHLTGQVDLILKEENEIAIFDLKTSYKESKTWPVQGSAYAYLAKKSGIAIDKIKFIHLDKWGKFPKIIEYEYNPNLFFSCLDVYKHFYEKKNK